MSIFRHTPSPEYRFWLYSPEGDGLTFWRTAEERDAYCMAEPVKVDEALPGQPLNQEDQWNIQ